MLSALIFAAIFYYFSRFNYAANVLLQYHQDLFHLDFHLQYVLPR